MSLTQSEKAALQIVTDMAAGRHTGAERLARYPEKLAPDRAWFTKKLSELNPDVICIQEIANQDRIGTFLSSEIGFSSSAFRDSSDGQDNAIFSKASVTMIDVIDPSGFQHPVQAAYVARDGFDAVIVTVHLSWTNATLRDLEKAALRDVVTEMLVRDPDIIVCGDFNTTEQGIQELAEAIGMVVMVPAGQDGIGTTHANNRYDHFLVSPDLANEEAVSCRIHTFTGEDLEIAKRVSVIFLCWQHSKRMSNLGIETNLCLNSLSGQLTGQEWTKRMRRALCRPYAV